MHLMFISNLYPPNQVGGYEELCWEVASQFAQRGHQVSVLTSVCGGEPCQWPRQKISQALRLLVGKTVYEGFEGPQFRRETISAQNRHNMIETVNNARPDVIFCWNLYGLGADFFDSLATLSVPVVTMLTDNWLSTMVNSKFGGDFFRNAVYGKSNAADYLVPNSKICPVPTNVSAIFGSRFMERFYAASGLTFANSIVVHNGVNLPDVNLRRRNVTARNCVNLLFAGRIVEIKGAHTAICALEYLVKFRPETDWRLNMVGDMQDVLYLERLQKNAEKTGVADRIKFPGRVAAEALPELFENNDIYLFPSLYEPFSLTLIHALASGIPTVATDIGGNGEIIIDGQSGLLFPKANAKAMANAVIRLADNPELAMRLGQAGAERARNFSTAQMIDAMERHLMGRVGSANA